MDLIKLLAELHQLGIRLFPRLGGKLDIQHSGNLTAELRERIQTNKPDLLELLEERTCVRIFDGELTPEQAEAASWTDLAVQFGLELVEPVECQQCRSVACWWDLRGDRHCSQCEPQPVETSKRIRQAAAAARLQPSEGAAR